jgi:ATP-dependent DNA helicase DinG
MTPTTLPRTFAQAQDLLRETLPNYVERPQQVRLATAVEDVINSQEITQLLGQAGCGVGKSLAYLIPAILSGKRVIVATSTKALQEQIANKDMPFLEAHLSELLGRPVSWSLLKGRSNYLCQQKLSELSEHDLAMLGDIRSLLDDPEFSGDVEHLGMPLTSRDRAMITTSSNECPGKSECPVSAGCFAERSKRDALDADVVITNTAMLLLDLRIRDISSGSVAMLGEYDLVILDEAHELPEIATSALSEELRINSVTRLADDIHSFASGQGSSVASCDRVKLAGEDLWLALGDLADSKDPVQLTSQWIIANQDRFVELLNSIHQMYDQLHDVRVKVGGTKSSVQRKRLLKRAANLGQRLTAIMSRPDGELVRWVEVEKFQGRRGGQQTNIVLKASPVDVAPFLHAALWSQTPCVLVSATLAVGGDFTYMAETLGLEAARTVDVGTPFDYTRQARLFLPERTAPNPKLPAWKTYSSLTIKEMVLAAGGGALLLFTSRRAMDDAYDFMAHSLEAKGIHCFKQGDAPNKMLAQQFNDDENSVLFALKSFFVGVDFQGRTCRLVVIDKMPFAVPTDLLYKAQCDAYQAKHGKGSDFSGLSIPRMTLTLIQGFGRLIRHADDAGVVAILDSRLHAPWAKSIARNLPPAPRIGSIEEVAEFFAG